MATKMVRAHPETIERLRRLQRGSGTSMADLLARAVALLEETSRDRKREAFEGIVAMRAEVDLEPAELQALIDEGRDLMPGDRDT